MQWNIQKADAYGGILLTRDGKVLLREPTNHFDGYVWTFAKGKPGAGNSPEETALREVEEECGYVTEIVDVLPGIYKSGLSSNAYFVMRHHGSQKAFDWETWGTRWVSFEEAERLINETTNPKGKQRDLEVLVAAKHWFLNNKTVVLPEAERECLLAARANSWENLQPLPKQHVKIELDISFNNEQSNLIRLGFIPQAMEQKWFSYFKNNVLYQFRSWTGICIDEIYFEFSPSGLRAIYAKVNRDPEQYSQVSDREDANRIENLLSELASPERIQIISPDFLSPLNLAIQPNYLGDPEVVAQLLFPYFESIILSWFGRASYSDKLKINQHISSVMKGDEVGYTSMPNWHRESALGSALIDCFQLDDEYCSGESLSFITSEALASIDGGLDQVRQAVLDCINTPQAEDVNDQLQQCWNYINAVFLGTHSLTFPDVLFADLIEDISAATEPFDADCVLEELTTDDTLINENVVKDKSFEELLAELKRMNRR
jgi:8-oxo-dGTP pyrophosphatase MutT (NUDIX family)